MFESLTHWIMALLREHGAWAVFIGVMIESVIVPLPSPLIIMGAGAILIDPSLTWMSAFGPILTMVVLPGAVAETLGAYFTYGIGVWGGKPVIERFSRFLGFSWSEVEAMDRRMAKRIGPMLVALRAVPIVPLSLISAAAGVLRIPFGTFTVWTFAGSVPRCLFLGYLGFLMRETYEGMAHRINSMESLFSGLIVVGTIVLLLWIRSRMAAGTSKTPR